MRIYDGRQIGWLKQRDIVLFFSENNQAAYREINQTRMTNVKYIFFIYIIPIQPAIIYEFSLTIICLYYFDSIL